MAGENENAQGEQQQWEQPQTGGDELDRILQQYGAEPQGQAAADSRPGSDAPNGEAETSGESLEEQSPDERIMARVLDQLSPLLDERLGSIRQDLQEYADRTAQSFSDRTAHRITEQQRQRLDALEQALDGLQDVLGPEYETIRRQKQLEILTDFGTAQAPTETQQQANQAQQEQQPGQQATGDFARVYLQTKLGSPEEWSAEQQAEIQRELSQARDYGEWIQVVDRYATQRSQLRTGAAAQTQQAPQQTQQQANGGSGGNIARAQPVQGGGAGGSRPTLEQLNRALNNAATAGDLEAMDRIGKQIDAYVKEH